MYSNGVKKVVTYGTDAIDIDINQEIDKILLSLLLSPNTAFAPSIVAAITKKNKIEPKKYLPMYDPVFPAPKIEASPNIIGGTIISIINIEASILFFISLYYKKIITF